MKLIDENAELLQTFSRLVRTYPNVAFAVAWASNTPVLRQLTASPSKIKKAVIGTHFFQTHPDVVDEFVGSRKVRFVLQPSGVFHPKAYLFWDRENWEALIGSANLTSAALTNNSETMLLIGSSDHGVISLKTNLESLFNKYWKLASIATNESASRYRILWEARQLSLRHLSGQYGKTRAKKPPTSSSVMAMSWQQYVTRVRNSIDPQGLKERCELLELARAAFTSYKDFASMELGVRQTIAGIPTTYDPRWGWFGSMKGAGYYKEAINKNSQRISSALSEISLRGVISRSQYDDYVPEFIKAFQKGGHGVAVASRLLALKRPDQFVCLDSKNQRELCKDFGIKQTGMNYERYWDEIVERILGSPWWRAPRPKDGGDAILWDNRAALLDVIFYRH